MGSQHHPSLLTSSPLILISDVATMVAWSLKKKEGEKKPDPKAAALPFYKRFTRKQSSPGTQCTSWSCCRRGFTPASTPSPPPSSSAKGWGQVGRLKTSEASQRHKLGQSQTMEESKKSKNRGNLNFLKVPQTKRPSMRDLPDTEKNIF